MAADSRPGSIILFERVYLLSIVYAIANIILWEWLVPPETGTWRGDRPAGYAFLLIVWVVASTAIGVTLLVYAARKASRVARAVIAGFFVLSFFGFITPLILGRFPTDLLSWLVYVYVALRGWCVWLLFKGKDADRWFAGTWQSSATARVFE